MIARIVTGAFNAQFGLLVAKPNWDSGVKISLEMPTDIAKEPITLNESRRTFAQSARYIMSWTSYLSNAADALELRIFLTRIRGEDIYVPLWSDQCELAEAIPVGRINLPLFDTPARYSVGWIIGNDDFSQYEIVVGNLIGHVLQISPGSQKAWPAGTQLYPLMVGRFTDRPQPESITDETMEVDFTVKENSNFTSRISVPAGQIPRVGSHIPRFATTPMFVVPPNFSRPLDWTEQPDVIYEQIGFLRQEQQRVYDHRNPRGAELEFFESGRFNIQLIERLWRDRRATTKRFMIPTWRGDLRMAQDTPVPGNPTWIKVEQTEFSNPGREAQPGDPYIALIGPNQLIDPYQLSSVFRPPPNAQEQVDRLVATQNVAAHTASNTILSHLLLVRFLEPRLEWNYTTPYLATTRIKFRELPHEYENTPADLPEPAYLFVFIEAGVRIDKFTSYENQIVIPTGTFRGTYVPAPFSFDTIKTGLKLDQEKVELKSFKFDGNPLNKMWPFALDGSLSLFIAEVNAALPRSITAKVRFFGDIWSVDADYRATAIAFGNLFERKFPRFLMSVSDNYTQFSVPTKIPASAFKITGTILSRNGQIVVITSAAGFAKTADYFAGGWLETGVNINFERRGVLHSEPTSPNRVTFHLDRPLIKARNNQAIDIYPGYDGSIDQCDTKFNNRINFGGHPYIPNVNPAVKAMKAKNVQGGKK